MKQKKKKTAKKSCKAKYNINGDEKMEQERKKINMNITDGDSFFAHEVSINYNPMQFILDFKNVTPRVDPRSQGGNLVLCMKHNVIMVDPFHAKKIVQLFSEVIDKYEKEFGKIETPSQIKQIEKKRKKLNKDNKGKKMTTKADIPTYFG